MSTFFLVCLVLYFLPTIIAVKRKHNSAAAIFVLNLLLGWSGLCWIIASVWSLTGNTRHNNVIVNNVVMVQVPAAVTVQAPPVGQAPVVEVQAPVDQPLSEAYTNRLDDLARRFNNRSIGALAS